MAIPDGFWTAGLEATADRMNQNLVQFDITANRPAAGTKGLLFVATDGTKAVSYDNGSAWVEDIAGGGLSDVVDDTTPQLGGDLDGNGSDITGIGHIGFLATQDASAGANDLDDYEEGTFTPTLQDDSRSDAESQTYSEQTGRYVKIGRLVYIHIKIILTSLGSLTGTQSAVIANLPFTKGASTGDGAAITLGRGVLLAITANQSVCGAIDNSESFIRMELWDAAAGVTPMIINELSADGVLEMSGFYEV